MNSWSSVTMGALAMILAVCPNTVAQDDRQKPCRHADGEYEQVLDAYFANARGDSPSAVVLRVYGGSSPEYEIVIDPHVSSHTVFRYIARKSIGGNVYDAFYTGKHVSSADYAARAIKVPFTREEFEFPEAGLLDLMARAKAIDTSICEHPPF